MGRDPKRLANRRRSAAVAVLAGLAITLGAAPSASASDNPIMGRWPAKISVGAVVRATGLPGQYRYVVSKGALQCERASHGLYTDDAFYIGDYRGPCANPLGFIGDIDGVAVANRAIDWSGN